MEHKWTGAIAKKLEPIADEIIARNLFNLVKEESQPNLEGTNQSLGFRFEEKVARKLWESSRLCDIQSLPPRQSLNLPTISGGRHQFDAGYRVDNNFHLFECKRKKSTSIEDVCYFNAKLIDYILKFGPENRPFFFRGTFVSYSEVGDQSLTYALAYGIAIIDPVTPPLQLIVKDAIDNNLRSTVEDFIQSLPKIDDILFEQKYKTIDPLEMCKKYRFYVRRLVAQSG